MPNIQLYPHNQKAFEHLDAMLRTSSRAAIIQPTGTGKSFVALAMMEAHPEEQFLYLSPSNHIFTQLRRHAGNSTLLSNTRTMTYQKLCFMPEAQLSLFHADYIILDEFHRCGAEEWGDGVRRLLHANPSAKLIGFTATPIRYLDKSGARDMAEELFGGSIAHYYSLHQALDDGILPVPQYILGDICLQEKLIQREHLLSRLPDQYKQDASALLQELRRNMSEAVGMEEIFRAHLPHPAAKLIVFCRSLKDIEQTRENMRCWLYGLSPIREYVCRSDEADHDLALESFIQDQAADAIRLLFSVNIVNEGLHVKDVDGIVMLRPTASPIIYLQQIGRCLASAPNSQAQPVIFDLVNNYESARIEGSGQRVFHAEFSSGTPHKCRSRPAVPFQITGNLTQFQTILDKYDHLFTRHGRWDFFYGLMQEFIAEHDRYPLHREFYCGVLLGNWLTHQVKYVRHGVLPPDRLESLKQLPCWDKYLQLRSRKISDLNILSRPDWYRDWKHAHDYLQANDGIYPNTRQSARISNWCKRKAIRYIYDEVSAEERAALEQLPNWKSFVDGVWFIISTQKTSHSSLKRNGDNLLHIADNLRAYTEANPGKNPPYNYIVDGHRLGVQLDRLRYRRRKGQLDQRDIALLDAAGMDWQYRERMPRTDFDTYFTELLRYREREGHIRVPQKYITPDTNCKLGVFIQRMRLAYKGIGSNRITPEQIQRLNSIGMVWDASQIKSSTEPLSPETKRREQIEYEHDRTAQ